MKAQNLKPWTGLVHPNDAVIERGPDADDITALPVAPVLMDCDGNHLFTFSDKMSDEAIGEAIDFANHAYRAGHLAGRLHKAREVREAMGL